MYLCALMVTYRHVLTMTSTTGVPVATAPRLRLNYYPPPLPHVSNAQPMHHFEIVMIDTNEVSAHQHLSCWWGH